MAIVQVRDADAVAVKVGDVLEWHLTENPSTGYERAISVDGGLEIELDKAEPAAVAMPGAAGQRVFRVRAIRPGDWNARRRLGRRWESIALERMQVLR
jgi:predicted secreted protein